MAQRPGVADTGVVLVTPQDVRSAVLELAAKIEAGYLDPRWGAAYAADLRNKADAFGSVTDPATLARLLTSDLQAVRPDAHLQLFMAGQLPGAPEHAEQTPFKPFGDAKWLDGSVAYIEWFGFPGSSDSLAHATEVVESYRSAEALIFDIRKHRGGGLAEMDVLFGHFFGKETHLTSMRIREGKGAEMAELFDSVPTLRRQQPRDGLVVWEHWTLPALADDPWFDIPIYVLTSGQTVSAAEDFAFSLKRSKRAVVVGETTRGGGHFGGSETIGNHFVVFMPVGETVDPETGRGWEGTGVSPDVHVPATAALDQALAMIGDG